MNSDYRCFKATTKPSTCYIVSTNSIWLTYTSIPVPYDQKVECTTALEDAHQLHRTQKATQNCNAKAVPCCTAPLKSTLNSLKRKNQDHVLQANLHKLCLGWVATTLRFHLLFFYGRYLGCSSKPYIESIHKVGTVFQVSGGKAQALLQEPLSIVHWKGENDIQKQVLKLLMEVLILISGCSRSWQMFPRHN